MYKPTKRVLALGLATGMILAGAGTNFSVQAKQIYDSSSVGISNKVINYIAQSSAEDPVSELTAGAVNKDDVAAAYTKKEEAAPEATASDAEAKGSPTDAKVYKQFQDRAVVTTEGKVNIRTEASTDSEVVGAIQQGGICLVKEIGDEWTKIASGTCEGYIKNEYLAYGDDAGEWSDNNGITRIATVNTTTLKVREEKNEDSDCVTLLPEGEEYYVYSTGSEWIEVSVDDDLRGFVKSEYVEVRYENPRAVSVEEQAEADRKAKEEADAAWLKYLAEQEELAKQQQQQAADGTQVADNSQTQDQAQPAQDGTITSNNDTAAAEPAATPAADDQTQAETPTEEATTAAPATEAATAAPAGQSGTDLANYALQFVGNPYVWGGTSLTNGADCSGFVLSVYAQFGYSLPHSAAAQSNYGTEVSLSALEPGDLLFYSNGGGIGHVTIYIGGGMVVHASNSRDGIKTSVYNYRTPVKAVRILGQ